MSPETALPSDEVLSEQAYLVARGVRPLALVAHFFLSQTDPLCAAAQLERNAHMGLIPWVLDHGDGVASCGYASERWAVDLYEWTVKGPVPEKQRERIVGLLLGYSAVAVARFDAETCGRRFSSASPAPTSSSLAGGNASTAGTPCQRQAESAWRGSRSCICPT